MAGSEGRTGEPQATASGRPPATGSPTRGFLFADLRGYTASSRGTARSRRRAPVRYRAIVRQAVAELDGAEIKTEGDSFYVVFSAVSGAVLCGLAIVDAAAVDSSTARPSPRHGGGRDPRG